MLKNSIQAGPGARFIRATRRPARGRLATTKPRQSRSTRAATSTSNAIALAIAFDPRGHVYVGGYQTVAVGADYQKRLRVEALNAVKLRNVRNFTTSTFDSGTPVNGEVVDLAVDSDGSVYILEAVYHASAPLVTFRVQKMTGLPPVPTPLPALAQFAFGVLSSNKSGTVAGALCGSRDNCPGTGVNNCPSTGQNGAQFQWPEGLAVGGNYLGSYLYVADTGYGFRIRRVDLSDPTKNWTSTVAGQCSPATDPDFSSIGSAACFHYPEGVAIDRASPYYLYVADTGYNRIRRIDLSDQNRTTLLAGGDYNDGYWVDGWGSNARFYGPTGLAIDSDANVLYVADVNNHMIRNISLAVAPPTYSYTGTVAGDTSAGLYQPGKPGYADGVGTSAKFNHPGGLAFDATRKALYVADRDNNRIRKIDLNPASTSYRSVTTLAGDGECGALDGIGSTIEQGAQFCAPSFMALYDKYLYVSDLDNRLIRVVDVTTGQTNTLSSFSSVPVGLAFSYNGNYLYASAVSGGLCSIIRIG